MTNDVLPEAARAYLQTLATQLADAPPDTAAEIVEDVRAHIVDALDSGRTVDQVLAALGSPQTVARQARDELALPDGLQDPVADQAQRAGRTLRITAVALGVLTAVCVSFLLPSTALPADPGQLGLDEPNVIQRYGTGFAMLTLLPGLVGAIPLLLRGSAHNVAGVGGAAVLTGLLPVAGFDLGAAYFPFVLLLWAALIVPWALRRRPGRRATRAWHLVAGGFVALPGLLAISSALRGTFGYSWDGVLLLMVMPLLLGVLCACGLRVGYAASAVAGAVVMVLGMAAGGFLIAAFWLLGGLALTVGASGFVATAGPRAPLPTGQS